MKISNNINNLNYNSFRGLLKLNDLSEGAVKKIQDIDKINSVGQRIIIGSTAMFLQPMIDMSNKRVDKDTRESSAMRSIARAFGGTLTGIAVRSLTIKAAEKLSENGKLLDFVTNEKCIEKMSNSGKKIVRSLADATPKQIKTYAATMGTILALGVMLFTNFLVDVPLINYCQNKLLNFYRKHKGETENVNDVNQKGGVDNVASK